MATPRKPAARKTASPARPIRSAPSATKTAGPVHFNVDTYENENPVEIFAAVIGKKRIEMVDPQDMDWQEVGGIDDPESFADLAVPEEHRQHFLDTKMTVREVNALMDAYMQHYGLGDRGNAAG
jgi:hypothetical protein